MKKQEFNGVTKQYLNVKTPGIEGLDEFKQNFKPLMKMEGDVFNQQFDSLIIKYPEIKSKLSLILLRTIIKNCG